MQHVARHYIDILWIALLLIWYLAALVRKQTIRREASGSRLVYLAPTILAAFLIFGRAVNLGPLERPFLPQTTLIALIGLGLTVAGIGFAVWARVLLGRNWSGAVTVKKDHTLVQKGPYTLVRHPIYTGVLLALLGTVAVFDRTRGLLGLGLAILALCIKLFREEQFMTEQFGDQYILYRQKVKTLIPFLW